MRLIDADELLSYIDRVKNCGLGKQKSLEYITKYIINMKTAFNVDKVARQIEDLKEDNFKRGVKENEPALLYASSCLHKALEIVKVGGIDVEG